MKFPNKVLKAAIMRFLQVCSWEIAIIISLGAFGPLWAQSTLKPASSVHEQAPNSQKSNAKSARVWTNDNIASARTPADIYKDEEESATQKPAEKTAAKPQNNNPAAHGDSGRQAAGASSLPDNTDAVEALIQQTNEEIGRKQAALDKASADVASAGSDLERSELKSNEEIAQTDLNASKDELQLLRNRLVQLKTKSATTNAQASGSTP